jgi:hypothetical protein
MKRLRTIGLTLLALLALGAFAASTASAEEGLLGPAEGEENSGKGGAGTLESVSKSKTSCKAVSILEVKLLPKSDIHGTADLHFTGCTAFGFPINSLGDASGVVLMYVLFLVCLLANLTFHLVLSILGEKLLEETGSVHTEVPALGLLLRITGAIIATNLSGLKGDKSEGKVFKFELKGKEGKQEVATSCEIAGKKLTNTLQAELNENGKPEALSWNATFELEFKAKSELMDT